MKLHMTAHHNSLLTAVARNQKLMPLLNLFWLVYVGITAVYLPLGPWVRAFTWASLVVFLPLYAGAWLDDRRRLPAYTAAIAALGLVCVPVNTCYSYVIYAASLVAYCGSRRQAVAWLAALLLAFILLSSLSPRFSVVFTAFAVALCVVVAVFGFSLRNGAQRDAELRLTHEELRRLAASAERERIGRDLHDTLGATLALIAVKSELAGRLLARDAEAASAQLADIQTVAREALSQVRAAVAGIRSAVLAGEAASARLLLESSGIAFAADLQPLPLPPEAESALALGLREATTNVQRHARAQAVTVSLRAMDGDAVMQVQDDGIGALIRKGHGLRGMEERLQALGGRVEIASFQRGSERGTRLTLRLPLPREAATAPEPAPVLQGLRPGASAA
jgi:two-component system sensor histidine kinase DesK